MAVCGSEEDRHGIVLAKNMLAAAYGIKTADTVYKAKKLCPNLVIAKPHYAAYSEFSKRVNDIYRDYTDIIEPFGIDESWLDVTASINLFGSKEFIAEEIRRRVKEEVGITVSIGVSFNKIFAKLGSDYKKPDAITYIGEDNFKDIVFSLPAGDLLFVGEHTETELKAFGIRTIGDLASMDRELLVRKFGKLGEMLYIYSNGLDSSPVVTPSDNECKSLGNGFTFKRDILKREEYLTAIEYLCEELGFKLRNSNRLCTGVSVTVKDEFLKSIQRQRKIDTATDVARDISRCAFALLCDNWPDGKPIRTLTVTVYGLVNKAQYREQIDIFAEEKSLIHAKDKKREETIDKIRQKYGGNSIVRGSVLGSDIGIYKENE